ncbi:dynamin-like GTPase family protein [soil metagenome]
MTLSLAGGLDALGGWRAALEMRLGNLRHCLAGNDLLDADSMALLDALRQRLAGDKVVLAFAAEFSRGKSELINALFFADAGRRILPATPGRTTMCPVEMGYDDREAPSLALLPIDTRLAGLSLSELRNQAGAWIRTPLSVDADRLAHALLQVTSTKWVTIAEARALGFYNDEDPLDNPPMDAAGNVEIPMWRHALINYPHPLLGQGLVVLDTPGLNAVGAEPELTLGLLPMAHATVFVLAADAGVSRSDLAIWRDHLGVQAAARYVVLNKIDTLADPLASEADVNAQIDRQQQETARMLGVPIDRVFPLSARQALTARLARDDEALARSRLPALEAELVAQLLPHRRQVIEAAVRDMSVRVDTQVGRQLGDRRRQLSEQMLELRGLRGKSGTRTTMLLQRLDVEVDEFEQCSVRLRALRSVHGRLLQTALEGLSEDKLREHANEMQRAVHASLFNLGAKSAFMDLCGKLKVHLQEARDRAAEIHEMLAATFQQLNTEFGFSLQLSAPPKFDQFLSELDLIERNYVQYLGLAQAVRLSQHRFMEQFRRMLVSKLRVLFESASIELDVWDRSALNQVESQLRDRRLAFTRRREALERVQNASAELEQRIAQLEAQDSRLSQLQRRVAMLSGALREQAGSPLETGDTPSLRLADVGTDSGFADTEWESQSDGRTGVDPEPTSGSDAQSTASQFGAATRAQRA